MPTESFHHDTSAAPRRSDAWLAAALVAFGLLVSVIFALRSPEGVVQFDDLTHYLYAKWAWHWPAYLLDGWGRPGFTAIYFLPAGLGWWACRMLSAVLTAVSAWLAFRIAQRLDLRHAWAAVPLCFAQPLFFQLAQTTLTETALAFYLTLAAYLAQRSRWSWSAAVLSLGLVTRHEAIIFLPLWFYFAWREQARLLRLWPIVWAPLLVNGLCWIVGLSPSLSLLLQTKPLSQYGHGGWLTFFCRAMEAWGPGLTVLAMTGLPGLWKKPRGGAMVAACAVVYFAAQTVVRALGLYESGGYARFLVPISPLVAIAALIGWQQLFADDVKRRRTAAVLAAAAMVLLWVAMRQQLALYAARLDQAAEIPQLDKAEIAIHVATATIVALAGLSLVRSRPDRPRWFSRAALPATLLGMMLLTTYALCHPLPRPREAPIVDRLWQWLAAQGLEKREIISAHVWFDYAAGQELPPGRPSVQRRLELAPVGSLFVWDKQFAETGHGLPLAEFENQPAFRLIHETEPIPGYEQPYLRIFEKLRPWGERP